MSIVRLLELVNAKNLTCKHPFVDRELSLKRCYLSGIAAQAHSDGNVSPEERELYLQISDALGVDRESAVNVLNDASHLQELGICEIRENLLHSKHKYYFILDLLIMALCDKILEPVETKVIQEFAKLLQVHSEEVSFLTELAKAVHSKDKPVHEKWMEEIMLNIQFSINSKPEDFKHYMQ